MQEQIFFKKDEVVKIETRLECLSWEIPSSLNYFDGHFPHLPVLPAVAIVDISLALIQTSQAHRPLDLHQVKSAKFHQPLAPGHRVKIVADQTEGEWYVDWLDADTLSVVAELRLLTR